MSATSIEPSVPSACRRLSLGGRFLLYGSALALLWSGAATSQAQVPSTAAADCQRATKPSERAICAQQGLRSLDGELGQAYTQARSRLSPSDQAALRLEQRAWLLRRNECGANVPCLDGAIRRRISDLQALPYASNDTGQSATARPDPDQRTTEGTGVQRRTMPPAALNTATASVTPSSSASATNPWGLPIRAGLPTLATIRGTTPAPPVAAAEGQAWQRAIRALGLSNAGQEPSEDVLVDLACTFMSAQEQISAAERSCASMNLSQTTDGITIGPTVRTGNEFFLHDLAQSFKERLLSRVRGTAPQLPFQFQIVLPAHIGVPYDFTLQRQAIQVQDLSVGIFGTSIRYMPGTLFWPKSESEARSFAAQLNNGSYYIGLPLTITGTSPSNYRDERYRSTWSRSSGLPLSSQWTIEIGAPTLYADVQLSRPLHRFTNNTLDQSTPAPVTAGPRIMQHSTTYNAATPAAGSPSPRATAPDSAESGKAAAGIWGIPMLRNLPAIPPRFSDNLAGFYMHADERSSRPDAKPWARMLSALTLAHMTQPLPERGLVTQACAFLAPQQQRALAGSTCSDIGVRLGTVSFYQTGQEFAARDLANGFQRQHLNEVIGRAPALPMRIMFVISAWVGPYDMERQRFTITTHELGEVGKPTGYGLWNSPLNFEVPEFYWPMQQNEARSYLRRRSSPAGNQPVFIGIEADLVGIASRGTETTASDGRLPTYIWRFAPQALALYEDAQLTTKLHDFPTPR